MNGDIVKDGQPIHHIDLTAHNSLEARNIPDGIQIVNGAYRGDDDLGRLMHDFHCVKVDDMFLEPMAEEMRFLKEKKEGRNFVRENIRNLIKEEFKDEIVRERAIAEQIEAVKAKAEIEKAKAEAENAKTDIALKLLADNKYSSEDICRLTGLSIDEILDLKKKLN